MAEGHPGHRQQNCSGCVVAADVITQPQAASPALETRAGSRISWQWPAFGAIALAACGHLLIKLGLSTAAQSALPATPMQNIFHYLLQPAVPLGLCIYGAGTLLWILAVSRHNISFLYPLTALNYVIVSLGAKLLFHESLSAGRCIGIAVVVLGVALLQLSARGEKS
jgi:drug/metabolite transporter (DMT)-like permease